MRPLRLIVKNFIGIRELDISFEGKGLFIIQGPNGAGKSSILEAIFFALYGETLRHGIGYEGVINRASNEGRALVELEFSHHGKRWRIKREVYVSGERRNSAVYLECLDSLERVSSSREASRRLEKLLGLTSDTFKTTVLLPQGEITSFLELTGTRRMKVLKELLGGTKLLRVIEYVDSDLKSKDGELRSYMEQIKPIDLEKLNKEKESLSFEIRNIDGEMEEIRERIRLLEEKLDILRVREGLVKELVKDKELKERWEQKKRAIVSRISEIEKETRVKLEERERLLSLLDELEREYEKAKKISDEVEEAWGKLLPLRAELYSLKGELENRSVKLEKLDNDLVELKNRFELQKRSCEKLAEEEKKLKEDYENARDRYFIHELRKNIKVGDTCPLCGSVVSFLPSESYEVGYEELRRCKRLHDEALKRLQEGQKKLARIEQEVKEKEMSREEYLKEIASLKSDVQRKEREAESILASIVERFGQESIDSLKKEKEQVVEKLRKEKEGVRNRLSALEASLGSLKKERSRLEEDLKGLDEEILLLSERIVNMEAKLGSSADLREIQGEIESCESELRSLRQKEISLNSEVWAKKSRLEIIERDIENYVSLKKKVEILQEEVALLGELKKNLSDSNFPKFLVSHYLIEASERANEYLSRLTRGRYSIEATEELELFVIDEEIGRGRRSIKDLSGGERVLISLSLALGIAEVLAGGLEAFFIDEGFSPLDRENLGMVAHELLELDNTGKLVGIITHDPVFADYFTTKLMVNGGRAWWA
ncbi:MAG: repair protein SbcC/Rad50 [bacterium]|nr:repair protein SbcC/Rad50 [bacterium]